jgi:hypothetical protein
LNNKIILAILFTVSSIAQAYQMTKKDYVCIATLAAACYKVCSDKNKIEELDSKVDNLELSLDKEKKLASDASEASERKDIKIVILEKKTAHLDSEFEGLKVRAIRSIDSKDQTIGALKNKIVEMQSALNEVNPLTN